MQPEKKTTRIVSQREYAKIFLIVLAMAVSSVCLIPLMAIGMAEVVSRSTVAGYYDSVIGVCLMLMAFFTAVFLFSKLLVASIKKILALEHVVPVTRANTADLSAHDSLVRASQEPVQEQQSILLRPAMAADASPPEQLLRSANDR